MSVSERPFSNFAAQVRRQWPDVDEPKPADKIAELLEQAEHAGEPGWASAILQHATVLAIREQTEQLRIGNLIALFRLEPHWADHLVLDDQTVLEGIREGLGL